MIKTIQSKRESRIFAVGWRRGRHGACQLSDREIALTHPVLDVGEREAYAQGWIDGSRGDYFRLRLCGKTLGVNFNL